MAKLTPNTQTMKMLEEQDVFDVEGSFYANVLPLIQKEAKNIKGIKRFSPECFHVDFSKKALFMEDLKATNYHMQERSKWLNKQQALLSLETLATMHGLSLRAIQKDPTIKDEFKKTMWGTKRHPVMGPFVDNYVVAIDKNMNRYNLSKEQCEILRKIGAKIEKENFKDAVFRESSFNVLCHGDCWMNNVMFHFSEQNEADDAVLIDYQITNYNSIGIDLNFFIFLSVASEIIVENLDFFLQTYFNKLHEVYSEVSFEVVQKEFYDRLFHGAVLAVIFRPLIIQEEPFDLEALILST